MDSVPMEPTEGDSPNGWDKANANYFAGLRTLIELPKQVGFQKQSLPLTKMIILVASPLLPLNKELVELTGIPANSISKAVIMLEEEKLVKTYPTLHDKRLSCIVPTAKGMAILKALYK